MDKRKIHTYLYNTAIVLCLIGGAVYAVSQFMHFGNGEFTDNARVRQNIVPLGSRIQGFIREVRFTDFQQVRKGDTLVIIEDAEFRLRLAQAEADLVRAEHGAQGTENSIVTTRTGMTVTEAGIESARARMENAMREDNRFKNLLMQDAVTRQQYDEVHTAYLTARASYEQAVRSRQMQSAVVTEQGHQLSVSEQGIELARRAVDLARLNLSYCYIIAPCSGTVGMKDIHEGQLVNPGQTLVNIVDNGERWIEANYKDCALRLVDVLNDRHKRQYHTIPLCHLPAGLCLCHPCPDADVGPGRVRSQPRTVFHGPVRVQYPPHVSGGSGRLWHLYHRLLAFHERRHGELRTAAYAYTPEYGAIFPQSAQISGKFPAGRFMPSNILQGERRCDEKVSTEYAET